MSLDSISDQAQDIAGAFDPQVCRGRFCNMQAITLALLIFMVCRCLCDEESGKFLGYAFLGLGALWILWWVLIIGFVAVVWVFQHLSDILALMFGLSGIYVLFCVGRALGAKFDEFAENRAIRRRSVPAFNHRVDALVKRSYTREQAIEAACRIGDAKRSKRHHSDEPRRRNAPFIDGQ